MILGALHAQMIGVYFNILLDTSGFVISQCRMHWDGKETFISRETKILHSKQFQFQVMSGKTFYNYSAPNLHILLNIHSQKHY